MIALAAVAGVAGAAGPASGPASSPAATALAAATQPAETAPGELMVFEEIPVVVGASKHEQKPTEAPASVTVVTAEEIELYGYRSLADILRTQRGFYTVSDGLNSFLGVRGFLRPGEWNARILVLIDGRPTREPIFGQTHLDHDMVVPVELIKRVEIIRGPGSALYGANAVFAVINIITRSGADVDNWAELKGVGGTQDTGEGVAVVGKKFANGADVIAGGSRYNSAGSRDVKYPDVNDAGHNYGHIQDHDDEAAGSAFSKVIFDEFTVEADYDKRRQENDTAKYLASWSNPGSMTERRDDFSMRWDHKISDDQSVHAQGFFSQYDYNQFWGQVDTDNRAYTYTSAANSGWFGQDVHYDWQTTKNNRLTLGSEAMQTVEAHQHDYDTLGDPLIDTDNSLNWWALYAQDEFTPVQWLTLVGGLRMDKIQRFNPLYDPRLAAIITPNKTDTFKLLYGRAFRAPNLYEMFYYDPGANLPNPNLKPEINDTYEVLWDHDWGGGLSTEGGYYLWRMKDTLEDETTGDVIQVQNDGVSWGHGIEGEVQKKWANGSRLRLSGSLSRATDDDGHRPTDSPDALVSLAGIVPVYKRTFFAVETQMVGPMLGDSGQSSPPTFLTNLVLTSKKVWRGLDAQVGLYNLFGGSMARIPNASSANNYQPWLLHPSPMILVSLTYRF